MKFTCNQQSLSKALNTVSKAVTSRTTIPILKGILLEASNDNTLTLSASDLDLSIEKKIEVSVEEEGSVVVSARLFSDIIRKLPNEDIEIEELENNNIIIRCLSSEFMIVGLPAEEFPNIGEINEEQKISLEKELLKEMIKKTSFAASIDESKGIIVGVLIEMEEDSLNMVALDGFRMAVTRENMKNEENRKIIISARILNEINKIISETEEQKEISVILDEKKAVFLLEDTRIVLRLLEGDFIKYKDILPKENKVKVKVSRTDLLNSIERASLLAKEGKNNLIKLSIFRDKVIITSRSEEGNVKEEVFIEKDGTDLDIGFNSKYILDVLKVVTDSQVVMEFNTSVSPCLIKPVEGNAYEYLVLPVRISTN
ncbi:DNA polymerase III subunit beta [Sinanaerobacter chloroacetimidivorans]|jgi:DNA polymerase-3 subunit beta|uniref:Beta sliding clamp n=1 Tax=Sinanaerobacter chloroacetimidivorans TaxID=2818044 RepID=A0A8J8B3K6_9FIRM|nr:DNA polymerase III subunit beta [Sinanaerobacter chloroacetimidivorans]MBR0598420.1 DNA polymerase III subunit beta [Sinanaerobacter chloroacetimidivorans]